MRYVPVRLSDRIDGTALCRGEGSAESPAGVYGGGKESAMKNNLKNWRSVTAILGLVVGLVIAPVPTAFADGPNPKIFPPNQPVFGMTYGEWAAKWWQWEFSLPTCQ